MILCPPPDLAAQDAWLPADGHIQKLKLTDGTTLYGQVEALGDTIQFRLVSGAVLELHSMTIDHLSAADGGLQDGQFYRDDPNRTRLFFGPTGRGLKAGQGYFAVYELFLPFLAVAPVDNVMLSGGTSLIFTGDGTGHPFWVAPKVRIWGNDKTDVAVGGIAVAGFGTDDFFGVAFGVVTHGTEQAAITVGGGQAWHSDGSESLVMIGGEVRLSRHVKLMTENYILPGGDGLVSFGPRFFGERLSADVGLATPIGGDSAFVFPIVNFVWNW